MNNYEFAKVTEIGRAADIIQSMKIYAPFWVDTMAYVNAIDIWSGGGDDLDESDD